MPQRPVRPLAFFAVLAFSTLSLALPLRAPAAQEQDPRPLPDLTGIVKDPGWARILGKALFWDTVAIGIGLSAVLFLFGELSTGVVHTRTWSKNAGPVMAPLWMRRTTAPVSRANSSA